ncbi:MAG: hypothetical protein DKM50_11600 [Candidatus Margulisiibacteriota bacterium]|nr:MAG: hypothetical protein A2X43_02335 [Candidatus Margulisbacteria bacterium GWD2_39_127]OGI01194.1 MAG: hypothetical protein A2X42_06150 [Candidatus Margulisbacteria bacterium GWF2_38_17]OGI09829.1 MAG: hypothetical protein A2X41_09870 [Candidatus Margulisbacteria bacterium GWE2_39_32]PZM78418.1 MAG: hypothetical protein DKM50_11600 [Candidatus Margulisiibacteriota bacterium]HAR62390.1 hypothetical protein [Candidatus Margulisiibacteriota bacterium]
MLIIILVLIIITVLVFVMAFNAPKKNIEIKSRIQFATASEHKKVLDKDRKKPQKERLQKGTSPLLVLLGKQLGEKMRAFLPAEIFDRYGRKLVTAGMEMKVSELLAMKIFLGLIFLFVGGLLIVMKGGGFQGKSLLTMVGACLFGFFLPDLQIKQNTQKRHDEVEKSLPFTLDLLKICVEAGLDLNSAFSRVVAKTTGPLSEELGRMAYEIRMGKNRATAMVDLGKRVNQPDLTSFITIVVQGEKTGMSMGKILSLQSEQIRIKRSQRVREKAAKIPVKMMIPMVLFILPAMFMILLGPAVIMMIKNFS